MANNGIYYSSGHSLSFTTTGTTWATLTSGGTFVIDTVSGGTYLNLPSATFTGGTVTGPTIFTSGLTANTLNVTGNTNLANTSGTSFYTNYIDFNLTSTTASAVSRLRYDSGEGGLVTTMIGGNIDLKVGQENVVYCFNGDTINLTKGQVVAIIGNQGNRPKIQRAIASAETTSSTALGVVSETINIGAEGFVTTFGNVRGFQITGITPGSYVYLSPTILGGFTGTQPQAPDHIVALGYVVRTGNTQGEIFVNINNGWEINELHNVRITNGTQNDILQLSAGTPNLWVNVSSPTLNGLTVTGNTSLQSLTATTISATTYQNLPGSSSSNCQTTFYVTNISGCSPINMLTEVNMVSGLTVTGDSTFTGQVNFTAGLSASTFSAATYQNLPVSAVTNGTGISASTLDGTVTVTNTDLGSSQNIFKNIQIDGVNQFSAGSNNSDLNFSGVNITITSAATNTLIFSAGTGGGGSSTFTGGTVNGATNFTNGLTANTISATTYLNLPSSETLQIGIFGDGGDGAVIVTSAITLTDDRFYTNLTISGSGAISAAGYRIFVSGTLDLTNAGANAISNNGGNATTAGFSVGNSGQGGVGKTISGFYVRTTLISNDVANGGVGGAGGASAGANGTAGSTPTAPTTSYLHCGGAAGAGGAGSAGNAASGGAGGSGQALNTNTVPNFYFRTLHLGASNLNSMLIKYIYQSSNIQTLTAIPTVGGRHGGGGGGAGGGTSLGPAGGSGGGGGGLVVLFAKTLSIGGSTNAAAISARGGNGGTGGAGGSSSGGGGGGGAGGGGYVYLVVGSISGNGTFISTSGGDGGTGGAGATGKQGGTGGTGGNGGRMTIINLSANTITQVDNTAVTGSAGSAGTTPTGGAGGAGGTSTYTY